MSEDIDPRLFESVILVDRAGLGGLEFVYGGRSFRFPPGQVELPCNRLVADFITGPSTQQLIKDIDGVEVYRLAVKGTPEASDPIDLPPPPVPDPIIQRSERAMKAAQRERDAGGTRVMAERKG